MAVIVLMDDCGLWPAADPYETVLVNSDFGFLSQAQMGAVAVVVSGLEAVDKTQVGDEVAGSH